MFRGECAAEDIRGDVDGVESTSSLKRSMFVAEGPPKRRAGMLCSGGPGINEATSNVLPPCIGTVFGGDGRKPPCASILTVALRGDFGSVTMI
jgi:hypothetical protein